MNKDASPTFAALVQEFFTDYMVQQRALSPRTVACYRDSFSLLLVFAEQRLGKPPTALTLADLDRTFLASFLDHLELDRHNSARSRNVRLAAIRSFLKFAARRDLANLGLIEQALAVPMKRFDRPMLGFLTREQMLAVLDIPTTSWLGQRDRLLLTLMYNTRHRGASLRDHWRSGRGRGVRRYGTLHPSSRQGPQTQVGAAVEEHRQGRACVVACERATHGRLCIAADPRGPRHDARERCPTPATGNTRGDRAAS